MRAARNDEREPERLVVESDLEALPNDAEREGGDAEGSDEPITQAALRKNRAIMTILNFLVFSPKWSVSLFLYLASRTTTLPTSNEKVMQPRQNLQAVVQTEAALYYDCVKTGYQLQDVQMDRVVKTEQDRVYRRHATIQTQIQVAAKSTSRCINSTLAAQRAMQGWGALGLTVPRTYNQTIVSTCTVDDQEQLAVMLSDDVTGIQNNVMSILEAYIAASLATMRKILQYSKDREAYDYNYFIGIKIHAVMDLLDHFTVPNIFLTFPEQQLTLELRGILQDLLDALHGAYIRVDLLAIRIAEFETSIRAFYLNYTDLYGRFAMIGKFVRDFLPNGIPLPGYFDISGLPLPSSLLPPIFEIPQFPGVLPNIDDLISEYIIKALKLISDLLQAAAEGASEQTRQAIDELIQLLKELLTLEDYNPPKYPRSQGIETPDDEVAYVQYLANQTTADTGNALNDLKKLSAGTPDYRPFIPDEGVYAPTLGDKNLTQFTFLDLNFPEIAIPVWILAAVGYIFSYTVLFDCATQAIRLYRLKCKYEKNATPNLPEIDYIAQTENKEKEESKPSKLQLAQAMLLKNLLNPWVFLALMIIPIALCILFFWFPHVKRTCIDSNRGTFLARHVFTQVLVNRANSQGYAFHMAAQLQCQTRQHSICSLESFQSDAAYRNDIETINSLQGRFNQSNDIRGVIDRCVDTGILDNQFETHCFGLEGYTVKKSSADQHWQFCPIDTQAVPPASFRPVGESLMGPACDFEWNSWNVTDSLFNCSVLEEACSEVPCTGVDANLIEKMTIDADCIVETYAIHVCIFIAFTIYHAIMINIGTSLLFNGILQVKWMSLKPDGIKFMTQVQRNGELVKGDDLEDRTDRIEKAMKRYVLAGYMQIGLSVAVCLFWIVTFFILKEFAASLEMYHA